MHFAHPVVDSVRLEGAGPSRMREDHLLLAPGPRWRLVVRLLVNRLVVGFVVVAPAAPCAMLGQWHPYLFQLVEI